MQYYTTSKAAEILGITDRHVRRLIDGGKIKAKPVKTEGVKFIWIISETDIKKYQTKTGT